MNKITFTENTILKDWLHQWMNIYKIGNVKASTHDDYYNTIERHISPHIGDIKVSELTGDVIQNYLNMEYESGNLITGEGLSNKSIVNIKNLLSAALQKAVDLDYIRKNPMDAVEVRRVLTPEMVVLTVEEEKKLIDFLISEHFSGKYDFAIYIALKLGLRNGEVCSLTWNDIDFTERVIHIRRRVKRVKLKGNGYGPRTFLQIDTPKSRESIRDIPFSGSFENHLKHYYNVKSMFSKNTSDYIFKSNTGGVADPTTVNDYFKRRCREIINCCDGIHFHCLRHTFATRAIEKNVDIKTLSAILGHTSVQFTLDRYAHVLSDQKRKTMELILN